MPRITKYPRLRTKFYKGQGGQAYVYYVYDMRPDGKPDVRLGMAGIQGADGKKTRQRFRRNEAGRVGLMAPGFPQADAAPGFLPCHCA